MTEIGAPVAVTDDDEDHRPRDPDAPFTGYAVYKGVLRFGSVTQISMFDDESDGCPRKWAFRYPLGRKLAKTGALIKGANLGESLFHYLTTSQDLLPPTLRPAKPLYPTPGPDLECERKFATGPNGKGKDIEKAIAAREQLVSIGNRYMFKEQVASLKQQIEQYAGLVIHDIPIDGAADFRHRRGNFVDEDGVLRSEVPGFVVVETGDQKVMSRIHAEVIKSGKNIGQILPTFAKTSAQICNDVQMLTYGVYAARRFSDSTHQRLSHVIVNKSKREAVKRTGLVSNEQLFERFRRIEDLVLEMEQCAGVEKIEDVRPNTKACDSYTHVDPTDPLGKRILQGCGYRYHCPLSKAQVGFDNIMGNFKEKGMGTSAFDQLGQTAPPPPNGTPAAPPAPPIDYNAALEAEKAKLAAGVQSWAAPSPASFCSNCGQPLNQTNSSVRVDGSVKHSGCPAAQIPTPPAPPPAAGYAPIPPAPPSNASYPSPPTTGPHAHPAAVGIPGYAPGQQCNGARFYANANGQGFITAEPGHKCSACAHLPPAPPLLSSSALPVPLSSPSLPVAAAPPSPPPPATTALQVPVGTGAVGVKPSDAPVHDWIDQAKPMPMNQIVAIEDGELRERALLHHKLWHERDAQRQAAAAANAPAAAPTSTWCPHGFAGDQQLKVVVTMQMSMDRKYVCVCGKSYSMGTLKPILENGQHVFVVPKHKPKNAVAPALPPAPAQQSLPTVPPAPPAPPPPQPQTATAAPPAPPAPPVSAAPPPPPPPPASLPAGELMQLAGAIVTTASPPPPPPPVITGEATYPSEATRTTASPPPPPPGEATRMVEAMFGPEGAASAEAQARRVLEGKARQLAAVMMKQDSVTTVAVGEATARIARAIISALAPLAGTEETLAILAGMEVE